MAHRPLKSLVHNVVVIYLKLWSAQRLPANGNFNGNKEARSRMRRDILGAHIKHPHQWTTRLKTYNNNVDLGKFGLAVFFRELVPHYLFGFG